MYQISVMGQFQQQKIEAKFIKSNESGLILYPLVAMIQIYLVHEPVDILLQLVCLALFIKDRYKFRYIIRIVLLPLLRGNGFELTILNSMQSLILWPHWWMQIVFLIINMRSERQILWGLVFILICRSLELMKRSIYRERMLIVQSQAQQNSIIKQFPLLVVKFDANLKIHCTSNENFKNFQDYFTPHSIKQIHEAMKKKSQISLQLLTQQIVKNQIQLPTDFQLQYDNEFFYLTQLSFPCGQQELINYLFQASDHLHHILCQDYQKWNNLRAFNVIKESDLNVLAQCTSDCFVLKNQLLTMLHLIQDCLFFTDLKLTEFNIRNYLGNLLESMACKLFEHVTQIDLEFDEALPNVLLGDKNVLMYLCYLIVQSLLLDPKKLPSKITSKTKIDERELNVRVKIERVDNEKEGYEIGFYFTHPCSQFLVRLYEQVYHGMTTENDQEKFIIHMLQKFEQMLKQLKSQLQYKYDGDVMTIWFTMNLKLVRGNKESENITFPELTFTRVTVNSSHWVWRIKMQNPRNSLQVNIPLEPEPDEDEMEDINNTVASTVEPSPCLLFPDLKDDIVRLIEETIQSAFSADLLDRNVVFVEQRYDSIVAVSEYADSVKDFPNSICGSPPKFISPQPKPRQLSTNYRVQQQKLVSMSKKADPKAFKVMMKQSQKRSNNKPKLTSQNGFFSPMIMKIFRNNLCSMANHSKKGSNIVNCHSSKNISEQDDSKNHSSSQPQRFPTKVFKNRVIAQHRTWTHQIHLQQAPTLVDEVLCFIPSTKWIEMVENMVQKKFTEKDRIFKANIVYDIHEVLAAYKQQLSQGKLYAFIMIYYQKSSDIIDIVNAIRRVEQQNSLNKMFIIGWCDKEPSSNFSVVQTYLNFVMIWHDSKPNSMQSYKTQIMNLINAV